MADMQLTKTTTGTVVVLSKRAAEVKDTIERCYTNISTSYYDLCLSILDAYENEYAREWGYDSLFEYAEKRLGMKRRSVFYLIDCAKAIRTAGLAKEQVAHLGWTKFKEIAPMIAADPERSGDLITLAEEKSSRELVEEVRQIKGSARPDALRLSLRFDGEAMAVVNDAMRLAYAAIGEENPSLAINHICAEWLLLQGRETGIEAPVSAWIDYIKRVYGVTLQEVHGAHEVDAVMADAEVTDILDEFLSAEQ